jgi:SET domain
MKLCLVIEYSQRIINCHKAIYDPKAKLPELNLGTGLYLASSLVNHSCDANMYLVFYGTTVVFRARRPITKGEQLTCCYVHPATHHSYETRQKVLLEFYKFKCRYDNSLKVQMISKKSNFNQSLMFQLCGMCWLIPHN